MNDRYIVKSSVGTDEYPLEPFSTEQEVSDVSENYFSLMIRNFTSNFF